MSSSCNVLICRCAKADVLSASRRGVLDAIARWHGQPIQRSGHGAPSGVAQGPWAVHPVDDLCELAEQRDPRLGQWAKLPDLMILACQERAVRALFAFAGSELPADCTILNVRQMDEQELAQRLGLPIGQGERVGWVEERSDEAHLCPDPTAKVGLADQTAVGSTQPTGPAVPPHLAAEGQWAPWFPVIDQDRCVHCRQCLGFCLFGVYALEGKKVRVANPRNCKPQCPACARVCPKAAIIFPKYPDGVICGADPATARPDAVEHIDVAELLTPDVMEMLRKRHSGAGNER